MQENASLSNTVKKLTRDVSKVQYTVVFNICGHGLEIIEVTSECRNSQVYFHMIEGNWWECFEVNQQK